MKEMNVLDKVTEAIERVLKSAAPMATKKEMTREGLISYAVEQIAKAAKETPAQADHRLRALGQTVETAKLAFEDTESQSIQVEVFEEDTTDTAEEESEAETPLAAASVTPGNSGFAENVEDLNKALARAMQELKTLRGDRTAKTAPAEEPVQKAQDVSWPSDMNTAEFREGVKKAAEDAPAWGDDPTELRTQEA